MPLISSRLNAYVCRYVMQVQCHGGSTKRYVLPDDLGMKMADTTAVIEIIRRIVADDTADLRERLQHIEAKITKDVESTEFVDNQPDGSMGGSPPPQSEQLRELLHRHEAMVKAIKAMHRLDATPVQWTRGANGAMVEAPEGLWEISCLACNHSTVWREGDKKPPQCKTWLIADGQKVE